MSAKSFLLTLSLLTLAPAAAVAVDIPSAQQRGPATLEDAYPYRPSCQQLVPQGSANNPAFNAWGPVIDGRHQNWYGLPNTKPVDQAYKLLDELGFCVTGGVTVPWSADAATPTAADSSDLSPLERKLQSAKSGQSQGEGSIPIAPLALGLAALGAWSYRRELDGFDNFVQTKQYPVPVRAVHPKMMAHGSDGSAIAPGVDQTPVVTVPSVPVADPSPAAQNPARLLASRLRSTLVTARTRVGKSMTLALSWPMAQSMGYTVWVLQPKHHPKEKHYWNGADKILGFMIEDLQQIPDAEAREERKSALAAQMTKFLQEWRKQGPKTLLIVDELRMIKQLMPEWYGDFWTNFMIVEMSSGETADRVLWAITQSSSCKDIGLSGGDRSTFDLFSIQTPDSDEHYKSLRKSFTGLPRLERDLFQYSESPKKAVYYHSAINDWVPMVHYSAPPNPVSDSASVQLTDAKNTSGSQGAVSGGSYQLTRAEVDLLTRVSGSVSVDLHVLMDALTAVKQGAPKTKVVEEILEMKGRGFQQGSDIYEQMKAVIDSTN